MTRRPRLPLWIALGLLGAACSSTTGGTPLPMPKGEWRPLNANRSPGSGENALVARETGGPGRSPRTAP